MTLGFLFFSGVKMGGGALLMNFKSNYWINFLINLKWNFMRRSQTEPLENRQDN